MYAVIKTGGKQYKVSNGDTIRVEKLDVAEGATIAFDQVLMIADGDAVQIGTPILEGVTVSADVKKHGRGKKIEIIKFRRRKHYRKQAGHRQDYTEIEITSIAGKSGGVKKAAPKKAEPKPEAETGKAAASEKKPAAKKKAATKKKTTSKKTTSKKSEKE